MSTSSIIQINSWKIAWRDYGDGKVATAFRDANANGATWWELYAGREGNSAGATFFMTELQFSTEGLNFINGVNLVLTLINCREGPINCGRISAILCDSPLTGERVYNLTEEAQVAEVALTYVNCSDKLSFSVEEKEEVVFTFPAEKIKPNQVYYIYLKRRIGLANMPDTSGTGGWCEFSLPKNDEIDNLILEYNETPDWLNSTEVEITPEDDIELKSGQEFQQTFSLKKKDTGEVYIHESLDWSYEIYNENNEKVENSTISWVTFNKTQTETENFAQIALGANSLPEYKVKIIATWGRSTATYGLERNISYLSRWSGLKSYIIGYILGLLGLPLPFVLKRQIGFQYEENGVFFPMIPYYNKEEYPYACLVRDTSVLNLFTFYISSKPFIYDNIYQSVYGTLEAEILSSNYFYNDSTQWTDFSKIELDNELLSLVPVWTNETIVDSEGNARIRAYELIPVYE